MTKRWECERCRDRGEVVTFFTDGSIERKPCPECGNSDRWDTTPHDAQDMTDVGDGLPVNYARDYVGNK